MRWGLALLLATGCTGVFGIKQVGGSEAPICFTETFDAPLDATEFKTADPPLGGMTAVAGSTLTISWAALGPGNYGHIETAVAFDLEGGYASVDVDDIVGSSATADLYVFLDDSHVYDISVDPTTVTFDLYDGDPTHFTTLASMPYFNKPLTLRVEHDAQKNQVVFSASSPQDSARFPLATAFTLQSVHIGIEGGTYDVPDAPGHAQFDNLTVASKACL